MKKNRNIKRNNAGFTLAEVLITVLILLIVTAIVATGMPMAQDAFDRAVDAANAETLLSTTVTILRGELSEAQYISGTGTRSLVYRSRGGVRTTLSSTDGTPIQINTGAGDVPLVTSETATERLHTEFADISYNDATGVFTVTDLCVVKNGAAVTTLGTFTVKTVNP